MSLLDRCAKLLKQSLDVFLAPAEDPRQSFPDFRTRQRNLLSQVDQALMRNEVLTQRLIARRAALESNLPALMTKARLALQSGREDLARLALQRRKALLNEMEMLSHQIMEAQNEDERLQIVRHKLVLQIEAIKTRRQVLSVKYSTADAQVRLNESINDLTEALSHQGISLEEAEQRMIEMQSRAAAIDNLLEIGVLELDGLGINQQLNQLDNSHAIDAQLKAIKKEIGL